MSCILAILIFTWLVAVARATNHTLFESIQGGVPSGWAFDSTPYPYQSLGLKIAIKQQNIESFEQKLLDISDPSHLQYGNHLHGHEVDALLKPTDETMRTVSQWLQEAKVEQVHHEHDWIIIKTDVQTANNMLNTTFLWYKNEKEGILSLRTLQYSVPKHVVPHIDLIQPTTRFGGPQSMRSTISRIRKPRRAKGVLEPVASVNATCNYTITPNCLLDLYNVRYKADLNNGNKLGFASFLGQQFQADDLTVFESTFAPYANGTNFTAVTLKEPPSNRTASLQNNQEANLDGQYAVSLAYPVPVTELRVSGLGPLVPDLDQPNQSDDSNEPYLDYLRALLSLPNDQIPQVISHSYGESEQTVPVSYNKKVCNMFAQLGARGVSVIFASGDLGVGDACLSNDGKNTTEFQPMFPPACPWVTSVGATYRIPEQAAAFSGGGFSRVYHRPKYQDEAVSTFLEGLGDQFEGLYDAKGRGFPDVSAQGVDYSIIDKAFPTFISGTSASSPTFAAIIALLNSARISSGMRPLGFLNPWLYKNSCKMLNDVTMGRNIGCSGSRASTERPNGSPKIPGAGFNATEGWDPVTGLGTPDFGKMLKVSTPWVKNEGGPVA